MKVSKVKMLRMHKERQRKYRSQLRISFSSLLC